jgi:hypothetical protein
MFFDESWKRSLSERSETKVNWSTGLWIYMQVRIYEVGEPAVVALSSVKISVYGI